MVIAPELELGIWNGWILQVLFYLSMFIPDIFLSKSAKIKSKRMSQFPPFKKTEKILALSTHAVIMPVVLFDFSAAQTGHNLVLCGHCHHSSIQPRYFAYR